MAIAVRSSTTYSGTGTSLTIPAEPAGTQALDRIVLLLSQPAGTRISAAPAGWTTKTPIFAGGANLRTYVFTPGGNAQPAPWVFNFLDDAGNALSLPYAACVLAIQPGPAVGGVTYRPEIDVLSDAGSAAGAISPAVVGPVTPGYADELLIAAVSWPHGTTFTPPGSMTEIADVRSGNGSTDMSLFVGAEALTGGANTTTGTRSIVNDNPFAQTGANLGLKLLAFKSVPPPTEWNGDLSTGDFSQYSFVEVAAAPGPVRAEVRSDDPPAGLAHYVRFTVLNSDVYPLTPTANPRAQLSGPNLYGEGDERWCWFWFRFPLDWPTIPYFPDGWLAFWQLYGPPFVGSPNVALATNGEQIMLQEYGNTAMWSAPLVRGVWHSFAVKAKFSADPAVGYVSGFYDGKPITFVNQYRYGGLPAKDGLLLPGRRRYPYATLSSDNTDGLAMKAMVYHKVDIASIPSTIAMDQAGMGSSVNPPSWLTGSDVLPTVRAHS